MCRVKITICIYTFIVSGQGIVIQLSSCRRKEKVSICSNVVIRYSSLSLHSVSFFVALTHALVKLVLHSTNTRYRLQAQWECLLQKQENITLYNNRNNKTIALIKSLISYQKVVDNNAVQTTIQTSGDSSNFTF